MPKIISFGLYKTPEKENPLKITWESFNSMEKFTRFMVISFFLFILSIPFIVNNQQIFFSRAQDVSIPPPPLNTGPSLAEFVSNEILIKVKNEVKGIITQNAESSGLSTLDQKFKQHKVKKFEKVVKETNKSKKDDDIFRWYKVELDKPQKTLKVKVNNAQGGFQPVDPETQEYFQILEQLKQDPNIEYAEPNFIVKALQTSIPPLGGGSTPTSPPTPTLTPTPTPISYLTPPYNTPSYGTPSYGTPSYITPSTYTPTPTTMLTPVPTPIVCPGSPNDPYFCTKGSWGQSYDDLWGLKKINMEGAWAQVTGSSSIIVADIDTGVDRNHEDLKDNMWINNGETPNNGLDDDGNGYVDDYYGCNFINMVNNTCGDPMDDRGHGTHTAGTIAAVGNNGIGVVGVNWTSKIMALKFLDSNGSGSTSDAVKAIRYAADMGAKVSSNSWGCKCQSIATEDAIKYAHEKGMVIVVAAGNDNEDALDFSPASSDRAITVAASDQNDQKAYFSNWGEKIDVSAPGVDILSTRASTNPMCNASRTVGTNYCRASGTSMSTPHVAGLAALLLAKNSRLTNEEVRQLIRIEALDLGMIGKDRDFGYGRIDVFKTLSFADLTPLTPVIASPSIRIVTVATLQVMGSIIGPNFSRYALEVGHGKEPLNWNLITDSANQVVNGLLGTIDISQMQEGGNILRLSAFDTKGKVYQYQKYVEVDNLDASISYPFFGLVSKGRVDIVGTAQTKDGIALADYVLEWGLGESPNSWSTTGIALANDGKQSINNGQLGVWDTSSLIDGQTYSIRLRVSAVNGLNTYYSTYVAIDKDLVQGWPKVFNLDFYTSTPALVDLDGDKTKEIIFAATEGKIHVFRKDGTNYPGFPVIFDSKDRFNWGVNVEDLDNDGKKEIVLAAGNTDNSINGKIYILRSNGSLYPGWPKYFEFDIRFSDSTPTIADIDGDGKKEIVFTTIGYYTGILHAYQLDGTELPGFPKIIPFQDYYGFYGAVAIADLDKDGKAEIAFAESNKFYLFDNEGNVFPGWPYTTSPNSSGKKIVFENAPSFGDIDGDGNLEIFASGTVHNEYSDVLVYGFRKDGSLLSGWPQNAGGNYATVGSRSFSPSLADVDNDGKDEVVMGFWPMSIFDLEGKKQLSNPITLQSNVAISDVNGDGKLEFAGNSYNDYGEQGYREVRIANNDGTMYWSKFIYTNNIFSYDPPLIADLDNDGSMELIAVKGSFNWNLTKGAFLAYLWKIPKDTSSPAQYEWPMFGHDPARTGRLNIPTPTPNSPPIINPIESQTVNEGDILKLKVTAGDPDGDKVTFQSSQLPAGSYFVPLGDVNLDGIVTESDAELVSQHIVDSASLSSLQQTIADANHDNSINILDSVFILQISKGLASPNEYWFLWQPTFSQAGTYPVTITVTDGVLSDSESVEITVNNVSLPDLIIEDIYQGGKEAGTSSDYVYMRYKNIGEQGTGDFFIKLSTQEAAIDPVLGFPVPPANESVRTRGVNISKLKLSPGETQEITAEIDNSKTIQESDENNNIFKKTVTIILPTVAITEPALNSNVSFSGFLFKGTAKANPSSLASVSQVRVRVYDYARSAFTLTNVSANYNATTKEWSVDIPSSAITSGSEARLEVRAKDSLNNWSDWKKRKVNVSN